MSSAFDLHATNNYTKQGNRELISAHAGMVYILEELDTRPRTVTLRNVDNLEGDDPDPDTIEYEDLPRTLRAELKKQDIRYRKTRVTGLHEVM